MKVPVSWIKEYVEIPLPIEELARRLTLAGFEVEELRYVGLPMPTAKQEAARGAHLRQETKITGLEWARDKIVVAAVLEVMPHPNADRLVLCRLDDGQQEHIVLTGAPNLFPYKGLGALERPLKVPYAREGAQIYDGHQPGQVLTTLKRAKIRGVESYSMICSEKELGISDDHEGIIILDDDAPLGMPLADYMGDAVLDIAITPNIARGASILGVAREVAALCGTELHPPSYSFLAEGATIEGRAFIEIRNPELNPRFVLGLIEEVKVMPSPYWVQRRLRLTGMRPINNVVDATNYVMLEIGEPLHAFDYDALLKRSGGKPPRIITRTAQSGERLTTLDGVERTLDDFTVLVCDTAGPLSIAGVMGGAETEVHPASRNILLEGAAWNFINIRRTIAAQNMNSEAAYRFSRGVHPAMAARGVARCLELMRQWSGGKVAQGLVDAYPLPPEDPIVEIHTADVRRWLGIDLHADEIAGILRRLEFKVEVDGDRLRAKTPDHRLDINTGVVGMADLMEEIARIYGYERIPETRLADELPPQKVNRLLEAEEHLRDLLADLGLQEVMTYRLTSPEREARLFPGEVEINEAMYVRLANPIAIDRRVMRRNLLAGLLEVAERNARQVTRLALFEVGPVYLLSEKSELPREPLRLAILMGGLRSLPFWQGDSNGYLDFYDLKGVLEGLFASLHVDKVTYQVSEHPTFHPGKCARLLIEGKEMGWMGVLHPLVQAKWDVPGFSVLAAELDAEVLLEAIPQRYTLLPVHAYPPVREDLALIVDVHIEAERVYQVILQAGGKLLTSVQLFDVYQGEPIEAGKKSLAYRLTYQAEDRTLTDEEVAKIRRRIVQRVEQELGATLRTI